MTSFEGNLSGTGLRVALVASRFNELIVRRLVEGSTDALRRHGVADEAVDLAWVPGALELPLVASRLAASGRYDAVIALGTVIKGATGHYDVVVAQTTAGLMRAQLDSGVPVILGVLTTDTIEQAIERAGTKAGNKGFEAAVAAIEVVNLLRALPAT
ncbi:MAG: 6,7-dimethyl-8-ribityllumazine synthase [Actinomycetota bacterium]|nr:6,7-dimethyl-8-ribityllumazine synthase [Actinomycetota bacterium]